MFVSWVVVYEGVELEVDGKVGSRECWRWRTVSAIGLGQRGGKVLVACWRG